jgi:hypothetical protein
MLRGERKVEKSNQQKKNETRIEEETGGGNNINSIQKFIDHLHLNYITFFNNV